jgi:hypothetical protein
LKVSRRMKSSKTPFERLLVDYRKLERVENGLAEGDASEGFGARH